MKLTESTTLSRTNWAAVLAAAFCGIAVAMNVGKVSIALPLLRAEFGLSLVTAGWVSSMINLLAVTSALLFGVIGDRVGAFRMCLAGLGLSALGSVGALFAGSAGGLLLSRLAESAGMVAVVVSAPALLSAACIPEQRRFALGIWSSYMPAGVGLVMLIAPPAIHAGGWQMLWLVTTAAIGAAMLALYASRQAYHLPPSAQQDRATLASVREALARPAPWLLGFAMGSWTVQHFALIVWLPTFLKEQRGLDPLAVSLLSCLMVLVNVPANLIGGALLQRRVRRGSLIAFGSLLTGLSGLGIFLDFFPDIVRYGFCLLLSFIGGLIPASVLSASASLARTPKQIGTLQGLFMQCGNLGSFIGPPLIAMLVASSGDWRDTLWVTGGAALLGIVLGLVLLRQKA
ncbi:Cyanate permease [Noviherbaspirillum humi]|uniref:Cyanate permease n=1 Tax=Noviherbaspirillum humi TaxID=1688639 RepID=A0A239L881_9BURK|nr:MFS transporter [Noviherbaspirillum humi]SNT25734.1 Cyanate permease [Noviherbaspirillum humi]